MRLIVVTGGIACGKTTAGAYFSSAHDFLLIDSDTIAHDLQRPHTRVWRAIVAHFGRSILNPDDTIDRKKLGGIVFKVPDELRTLNQIVHPAVLRQLFVRALKAWLLRRPVVVIDIPLFFEGRIPRFWFHDIAVVAVDRRIQIERLISRNRIPEADAERRLAAQMPIEEKCRLATVVIRNDGTREELERNLDRLAAKWRRGAGWTYAPDPLIVAVLIAIVVAVIGFIRNR
jgi:dephospho-CoA kinase